jgi:site-specific DNA recombinase
MTKAVLYARVSSREQEREGYSIPAQQKLLAEYAKSQGFQIAQEFIDVESAKNPGRKHFGKMVGLLETDPNCRIVLVEKTDRLYRNRKDSLTFEELIEKRNVEVHLVKEGRVIGKDSRSQDKFTHDIHVAVARNYSENLREEVKKGMREKAEQGVYPARAPFGYRNDKTTRTIVVDPERTRVLKRIFELYGSGQHSLTSLRKALLEESGTQLNRAYLEKILKSRFYLGYFFWQGVEYKGTHPPLIDSATFDRVQAVFAGRHKPRHRKHDFAFGGLLRCAHDGCTVTAEHHKGKYTYYRCSYGRGKCDLPYMPEPKVSERLGEVLRSIYVPEDIAAAIVSSLESDRTGAESLRQQDLAAAKQRLAALRTRMDQMYEDKLDGKIDEDFWARRMNEWREQERCLEARIEQLSTPLTPQRALTVQTILELANKAYSLYLTRNPAEQGQLLRMVLLNCATDGVSLWPTYRKPFDLIFQRAQRKEWSGREDLNLRPPGPEPHFKDC